METRRRGRGVAAAGDVRERRLAKFRQNVARFQLYRNKILQEHTRWKALAEIYAMHSFAPFSNLEKRKK